MLMNAESCVVWCPKLGKYTWTRQNIYIGQGMNSHTLYCTIRITRINAKAYGDNSMHGTPYFYVLSPV